MTADQDELVRRIRHVVDRVQIAGVDVQAHHPQEWTALALTRTELEEKLGWCSLDINHEANQVTLHICPALLAAVTVSLPWSPEPDGDELILDEDAIANPDDATVTLPVDDSTRRGAPCPEHGACGFPLCGRSHSGLPAVLHYEAVDDPDPDGYWFFDNLVRLIVVMAEAEMLSFVEDEMTGVASTPSRRVNAAWEHLYRIHPAVHRFVATAMATALDLVHSQEP